MNSDETIISSLENLGNSDEKKPFLTFIKGVRLGQFFPVTDEEMVVGRSPDCSLWIEDTTISRKHFSLRTRGGDLILEDLGSTNGTYVNGQKLQKAILQDGDKIQVSQDTILEITYLDKTRVLSEKKRYEMGVMDPVTNIYNKRYFLDRFREEFAFAKRRDHNMAMLMLDIDHFKKLNDTYGHLAGDLTLSKVCEVISGIIREDDLFARYGGEEFVIVMRDAKLNNALDLAERIRAAIESCSYVYEDQSLKVTVSIGAVEFISSFNEQNDMIQAADDQLYRAKKSGRNQTCS